MSTINLDTIDLSMTSPKTGEFLTANIYTVDGVVNADGSLRQLSIGGVVMAICLARAAELEEQIVELMEDLNKTSSQLEALTEMEEAIIDWPDTYADQSNPYRKLDNDRISQGNEVCGGQTYRDALITCGYMTDEDGKWYIRWKGTADDNDIMYEDFITDVEALMDDKNSISQQTMIKLQSLTNKRDQAYDMISNILKSLNTVLTGTVNNI